jgi:type IV pilus assembly protein PilB
MTNKHESSNNKIIIIHNRQELASYMDHISNTNTNKESRHKAVIKLLEFDIEPNIETIIPAYYAQMYNAVPLMMHDTSLVIAISDHANSYESLKNIEFITSHHVEAIIADSKEVAIALERLYSAEELIGLSQTIDISTIENRPSVDELRKQIEEKPLVELVKRIIHEAIKKNASDIHLKPTETDISYSLRIDGNMVFISNFDKRYLNALISRFKIIGGMNIAEHRLPQDGGAKISVNNQIVEVRLSVMPTIHGESLVVRLLQTNNTLYTLDDLHFSPHDHDILLKIIHQSNGLILACGPTGSGKSTTLYALLQEIKKDTTVNIITTEDPVEFHIDDIEQIQVNRKTGYTFATALRNILRHDPDVIMVGEIRDEETAKITIECALTGHLVLSTLHSVDAISSVSRLLEMGVKPYLLKATLSAVIAQRLAKLNCKHCLSTDTSELAERLSAEDSLKHIHWKKGKGCRECNSTGLHDRRGIFEVLHIDKHISRTIRDGVTEEDIENAATSQQMETLAIKAQKMAEQGEISAAEYIRLKIE